MSAFISTDCCFTHWLQILSFTPFLFSYTCKRNVGKIMNEGWHWTVFPRSLHLENETRLINSLDRKEMIDANPYNYTKFRIFRYSTYFRLPGTINTATNIAIWKLYANALPYDKTSMELVGSWMNVLWNERTNEQITRSHLPPLSFCHSNTAISHTK